MPFSLVACIPFIKDNEPQCTEDTLANNKNGSVLWMTLRHRQKNIIRRFLSKINHRTFFYVGDGMGPTFTINLSREHSNFPNNNLVLNHGISNYSSVTAVKYNGAKVSLRISNHHSVGAALQCYIFFSAYFLFSWTLTVQLFIFENTYTNSMQ